MLVPQSSWHDGSERELVFLAVLADVGHGRVPVSHRGSSILLYTMFAVRSPDCLLNSLDWSMSYVDPCLAWRVEPEMFVDLGSPPVNVVEDAGNRSVCFHRARLRHVVFCNMAGHSVVFIVSLRQSPEESHRMCSDGRIEVQVFLWCVAEGTGSEGKGAHGKAFWAHSVDDGALSGSKLSLVCWADTGCTRGLREGLALSSLAFRFVVAGIPPIFLTGRLAFMILRVSVGAITFLVMLICPPRSRQCVTTGILACCNVSYLVFASRFFVRLSVEYA